MMGRPERENHKVNTPWQAGAKHGKLAESRRPQARQADSNYDFRDSLKSLVKSHLCNNQSYCSNSSSNMSNKVPCNNSSKPFPHDQNMLLGENAAFVIRKQLSLPSHANQGLNVIN